MIKNSKIFGELTEFRSFKRLNLQPNEFSFKVDRKDGTFMGAVVNIDGTIYENHAIGDGIGGPMRKKAERAGLRFVTSTQAGLC